MEKVRFSMYAGPQRKIKGSPAIILIAGLSLAEKEGFELVGDGF